MSVVFAKINVIPLWIQLVLNLIRGCMWFCFHNSISFARVLIPITGCCIYRVLQNTDEEIRVMAIIEQKVVLSH